MVWGTWHRPSAHIPHRWRETYADQDGVDSRPSRCGRRRGDGRQRAAGPAGGSPAAPASAGVDRCLTSACDPAPDSAILPPGTRLPAAPGTMKTTGTTGERPARRRPAAGGCVAEAAVRPRAGRRVGQVGRVLGTQDATPLSFWVAIESGAHLQLDDVVVTARALPGRDSRDGAALRGGHRRAGPPRGRPVRFRRLPDRRGCAARRGPGGGRNLGHPGRPRAVRAAAPGRPGPSSRRRRAGRRAVLRHDGAPRADGPRPRRRPRLPELRLPGRVPRRAHLGQRHLRRGDQDQLRAVPALLDLPLRCAGRPGSQHEGARVQRQGRGPAFPRPAEHPPGRRRPRQLRPARAAGRALPLRAHLRAPARPAT